MTATQRSSTVHCLVSSLRIRWNKHQERHRRWTDTLKPLHRNSKRPMKTSRTCQAPDLDSEVHQILLVRLLRSEHHGPHCWKHLKAAIPATCPAHQYQFLPTRHSWPHTLLFGEPQHRPCAEQAAGRRWQCGKALRLGLTAGSAVRACCRSRTRLSEAAEDLVPQSTPWDLTKCCRIPRRRGRMEGTAVA